MALTALHLVPQGDGSYLARGEEVAGGTTTAVGGSTSAVTVSGNTLTHTASSKTANIAGISPGFHPDWVRIA